MSSAAAITLYTRLLEAWNRRDAAAFAALFTPTALAIGFDGSEMDGRAEIARQLAKIFAHHPTPTYVAQVRCTRALGAELTLLHAAVGMVPAGGTMINPAVNALQTILVTAHEAGPAIALLQSTPAAYHGRPHLVEAHTAAMAAVHGAGAVVHVAAGA